MILLIAQVVFLLAFALWVTVADAKHQSIVAVVAAGAAVVWAICLLLRVG
jgi:hypothetical protein